MFGGPNSSESRKAIETWPDDGPHRSSQRRPNSSESRKAIETRARAASSTRARIASPNSSESRKAIETRSTPDRLRFRLLVPIRPKAERQLRPSWRARPRCPSPRRVPIRPKAERQLRLHIPRRLLHIFLDVPIRPKAERQLRPKERKTAFGLLGGSQFVRKPKGN